MLLGRRRNLLKISLSCRSISVMCWLCQFVASTPTHWHFEERSIGSPMPTAVSLRTDSFVSSDSDYWSTVVTYELPCQCVNTGCLNWQEISSKYLTFQPRARYFSIVLPAGAGGSWKRVYKHSVQTDPWPVWKWFALFYLIAWSTRQTLAIYMAHNPWKQWSCQAHQLNNT